MSAQNDGLKGLPGLNRFKSLYKGVESLSEQERNDLINLYIKEGSMYEDEREDLDVINEIYRNRSFIEEFGREEFNKYSHEDRNYFLLEKLRDELNNQFISNPRNTDIINLTDEGIIDLLDSGYNILTNSEDALKKAAYNYAESYVNDPFLGDKVQVLRSNATLNTSKGDVPLVEFRKKHDDLVYSYAKEQNDILDEVLKRDALRKEQNTREEAALIEANIIDNFSSGKTTAAQIEKTFNELAESSPHWDAFKDTYVLEDFDLKDKIEAIAKSQAIESKYQDGSAMTYFNANIQEEVAKNQTASDQFLNTTKSAFTTGASTGMGYVMGAMAQWKHFNEGERAQSLFLQGKNSDGSNIDNWFWDPTYWQGVESFNVFSPTEVKAAQERGGISTSMNVYNPGEELSYSPLRMLGEAWKQSGRFAPQLAVNLLTKGAIKIAASPFKLSVKGANNLNKAIAWSQIGVTSVGMAHLESMESFQNALLKSNQLLDSKISTEVKSIINDFKNTEDYDKRLQDEILSIKKEIIEEAKKNNSINAERGLSVDPSQLQFDAQTEQSIKDSAIQNLESKLIQENTAILEKKYESERYAADEIASRAYNTSFMLSAIKTGITSSVFHQFLYDRGALRSIGLNNTKPTVQPKGNWFQVIKSSDKKELAKAAGRNIIGEGIDEYADGVINRYGTNVALSEYNNLLYKENNPNTYSAVGKYISELIEGKDKTMTELLDDELLYEAAVGAFSGGVNLNVNLDVTQWGKKEGDEKLHWSEKFSKYFTNSLISDLASARRQEREVQSQFDAIQQTLKDKNVDLEHIINTVGAIADKKMGDTESTMSAIDGKNDELFQLVNALNSLKDLKDEYNLEMGLYDAAMEKIQQAAKGNITEEMIQEFKGQPSNKPILENNTEEEIEKIAKEQIQGNAQKYIKMQDSIEKAEKEIEKAIGKTKIDESLKKELVYLRIKDGNWKERLQEITTNLKNNGIGDSTIISQSLDIISRFGNKKNLTEEFNSQQERVDKIKEDITNNEKEIEYYKKLSNHSSKEVANKAKENLRVATATQNLLEESLSEEELKLEELSELNDNTTEEDFKETLKEEDLRQLGILDLARVLQNPNKYSKKQQLIIQSLIRKLDHTDANLVEQIVDAAELKRRIEDSERVYYKLKYDPIAASIYAKNIKNIRQRVTTELIIDKIEKQRIEELKSLDDTELVAQLIDTGVDFIDKFIEENPNKADVVKPAREVAQLREDVSSIISRMTNNNIERAALTESFLNITKGYTSKQGIFDALEEAINDENIDDNTKNSLSRILKALNDIDEQRGSTNKNIKPNNTKGNNNNQDNSRTKPAPPAPKSHTNDDEDELLVEGVTKKDRTNIVTEEYIDEYNSTTTLVGNARFGYDPNSAKASGTIRRRRGKAPGDNLNKFLDWLDNNNIKLQEIIDTEVHQIFRSNPERKIHYMIPNDKNVQEVIFLVVEYDDDVKKIHNENLGGVIPANGKEYLIIGNLGYNDKNKKQKDNYYKVNNQAKQGNTHKGSYVNENVYTQLHSMGTGWLIRSRENEPIVDKSIFNLLEESRNPYGLTFNDLKWMIVGLSDNYYVNTGNARIRGVGSTVINSGNTFLYVPASDGSYVPAMVKPMRLSELDINTELYRRIQNHVAELIQEFNATKNISESKSKLKQYIALYAKEAYNVDIIVMGNDLVISNYGNEFPIDTNQDIDSIMKFIIDKLNPRINITPQTLQSENTSKIFSDAGALDLDLSSLSTANASFSVYPSNDDGGPLIDDSNNNKGSFMGTGELQGGYRGRRAFTYKGSSYKRRAKNTFTDANGNIVEDEDLIQSLEYFSKIGYNSIAGERSVMEKGNKKYYLLESANKAPEVVIYDTKTEDITIKTGEWAELFKQRLEDKLRQEAAERALESEKELRRIEEEFNNQEKPSNISNTNTNTVINNNTNSTGFNVEELMSHEDYSDKVFEAVSTLIENGIIGETDNISNITESLKKLNIQTTGITDIDNWCKMVKECKS